MKISTSVSVGKEFTCSALNAGDGHYSLVKEDSPGGGHDNSLQSSFLENPIDEKSSRLYCPGLQRLGHE